MLLLNFTFSNYASFKQDQLFTMKRVDKADKSGNWAFDDVSPVAAVYGANASGKSRFLDALRFVSWFVANGYARGNDDSSIGASPFLLDKDSRNEPSSFLVEFVAEDGLRYKYWFSVTSSEVIDEELLVYRSRRPSLLFSRSSENGKGQEIEFGSTFKGAKQSIWEITRPNSLFLSAAATAGNEGIRPVYNALSGGISFYDAPQYSVEISSIKRNAEKNGEEFTLLRDLIQYTDFGITGLRVQERKQDYSDFMSPFVDAVVGELDPGQGADIKASFMKDLKTELAFQHKGTGVLEWFPVGMESDGTVAALSFLSVALKALSTGRVALVDEIDKSLHPWLVREFVSLFVDPETNPLQAQLIFTSHDESLIDESGDDKLLGRDQIWLTEKDKSGESELVAVTEYSPRKQDNIGRKYSQGVYGAVPMLTLHAHFARAVDKLISENKSNCDDKQPIPVGA